VKSVEIAELKKNLSRYLDHVKAGRALMVLERDRPVAWIVPLSAPSARRAGGNDARLARLERRAVIRRGTGGLPDWLGRRRPPRLRGSVLRDVLAERRSGS
jgi:antitoxin (DNA-binding transcriptional repressor) of toxin-antitoxin stability system